MAKVLSRKNYKGRVFVLLEKDGKFYVGNTKKRAHRTLSGAAQAVTSHPTSGKGFWKLLKK